MAAEGAAVTIDTLIREAADIQQKATELDDRSFEWDMYVDLPAGAVRYCFRSPADATAFRQRFVDATQGRAVGGGN